MHVALPAGLDLHEPLGVDDRPTLGLSGRSRLCAVTLRPGVLTTY